MQMKRIWFKIWDCLILALKILASLLLGKLMKIFILLVNLSFQLPGLMRNAYPSFRRVQLGHVLGRGVGSLTKSFSEIGGQLGDKLVCSQPFWPEALIHSWG